MAVNLQPTTFTGKSVLITGAGGAYEGRGMGRVISSVFASAGARVVAADIDIEAARATADAIVAEGGECVAVQADVASSPSVRAMVQAARRAAGGIDVLVNHAGIGSHELVADTDDATWRLTIGVSLDGPFYATREILPLMIAAGGGSIVNTISICGLAGGRAGAAYTAAKHGLVGLTKSVAATYASAGIRCNGVCPGRIRATTADGGSADAPTDPRGMMTEVDETFIRMGATSPRDGSPDEVAAVIAFLASDAAAFVNGAIIPVDGGWIAT
jgi:NAD(P)-dependent dehydrogenase (short-subunit alcohol dehydrogenase family)